MECYRVLERLQHILAAIAAIRLYSLGMTLEDYRRNPLVADAVERNLERISEAVHHLPQELLDRHAAIPWRQIADLGNILRHAYDRVSDERLWHIVADDLDPLSKAVESLCADAREPKANS